MYKKYFTIIMPVYNSEKFLNRSISSVLSQDYKSFEFLIIDDHSNDNSEEIIRSFSKKDNRITFFKNERNLGVSKTRNLGLNKAIGKYILFLDSDDELPEQTLSNYIKVIKKTNADIIQGEIITNLNNKNKSNGFKLFTRQKAIKYFLNSKKISGYAGGKIYKKSTIDKIRFNENISYGEDGIFAYCALLNSKKVVTCNFISYIYKIRDDSLSNRSGNYNDNDLDTFYQIDMIKKKTPKAEKRYILVFIFEMYLGELRKLKFSDVLTQKKYAKQITIMNKFCRKSWIRVLLISINPRVKIDVFKYLKDVRYFRFAK